MISYPLARRRFPLAALAAGLVLLAGCGDGGDSESSTLVVGFDYPSAAVRARVFEPVSVAPAVSGLQGNTPTFAATDPLPAGLALDSRSGTISGVPTRRGDHIVGVELTVPGYEGRLLSSTRIMVTTPFAFTYGISYEIGLTVGQPMTSPAPTVTGLQGGRPAVVRARPRQQRVDDAARWHHAEPEHGRAERHADDRAGGDLLQRARDHHTRHLHDHAGGVRQHERAPALTSG